jgi:tetratricopeptide (TPR) repeat protein
MTQKMIRSRPFMNLLPIACLALLCSCGGGTGIGPGEIQKREDRLLDRLPIDWNIYNESDHQGAIDFFTKTLEQADAFEGVEGVKNQVKSEAQSGIGWSFFQLQDLSSAEQAFAQATQLDRQNADAWAGWAGVALALRDFGDAAQYSSQALETDPEYNSATRVDASGRFLGHDNVDERHLRLMLAEAYFQIGTYGAIERNDPNNAAAQVRFVDRDYRYQDPGQLLQRISELAVELQSPSGN